MRLVLRGAVVLTLLVPPGCGGGGDPSGYEFCESPIEVIFEPGGEWLLPFPSNLYLRDDEATPTGFRVALDGTNLPASESMFSVYPFLSDQLNALDGFGTSADIVFGFTGEIGSREFVNGEFVVTPPASLVLNPGSTVAPDTPAVLIDITDGSPGFGEPVPLLLEYISDRTDDGEGQHYLMAEPAYPLRPATTYALALTTRLTDNRGYCVAPSQSTRHLLTGELDTGVGLLAEQAPKATGLLEEKGFIRDVDDLSALTAFTTQSIGEELLSAAGEVLSIAQESPPGIVPGSLATEAGTDGVALVVTGRFEAPTFRGPDGTFVLVDGVPVPQGSEELEFELMIPEETADQHPPFPVVIYQHGLTGHKGEDGGAKRAQARAGFASLAIDAVLHGSRQADTGIDVLNFLGIDLEGKGFDMPALRDNFRQAYLDILFLAELGPALAELDLLPAGAPDGVPELEAEPVYLSGHSLGSIIACGGLALSPRIPIGNLSAGGGRLTTNLFMRSELLGNFIDMLKPPGTTSADVRRFMPLLQMLIERGDPVNLGGWVAREPLALAGGLPKHVLLQEVEQDGIVPNEASESLARALGLGQLKPVVHPVFGLEALDEPASGNGPGSVTAVMFQFDRLVDGEPAGHKDIYSDRISQIQWIHFFETYRDGENPQVLDPYRELGLPPP